MSRLALRATPDRRDPEPASTTGATGASSHLERFVALVALAGSALLVWQLTRPGALSLDRGRWVELGLFVALLVLCEIRPVTVNRGGAIDEIVASTTFAFALLLAFGPAVAMIGQSAASLIADVARQKGVRKITFNVGQYWVAWGIAGLVFEAISGQLQLTMARVVAGRELAAMLGAALTYFLINSCLVGAVVAIHGRLRILRNIRVTLAREVTSDWVLLALAPVVFVVAERSVILLPLLLLPVLAVYRSAAVSIEKDYQASHDTLTHLPNRLSFADRLDEYITRARRGGTRLAVVLIDLDRFKEVNDTLGHQSGDALLKQIGIRISDVAPEAGIVARFGGDEFAVLFDGIVDDREAASLAAAIVEGFSHPFQLDDFRLDVEASAGVAIFPDHGDDDATLLQHADTAMYVAKANHSGVELYDARKDHHSRRRLGLLGELRTALRDRRIVLHYQPKLDLHTARVQTVEALVRWDHPDHGLIPPADFVPLAERTGLIRPLTTYVIEAAIAQARHWLDQGLDIPVAVNLSARNLYDTQLPDLLASLLERWQLPASNLHLEITESSIMSDPARARRILTALDAMGLRVVIDDFGTGYSSLAYLQRLPVREIKVDRSFVLGMVHNDSDHIIVRSTIDLARNLGLEVTAEGVETEAALRLLRAAECNAAQGYFISRPIPADELEAWLASDPGPDLDHAGSEPDLDLADPETSDPGPGDGADELDVTDGAELDRAHPPPGSAAGSTDRAGAVGGSVAGSPAGAADGAERSGRSAASSPSRRSSGAKRRSSRRRSTAVILDEAPPSPLLIAPPADTDPALDN